MTVANTSSFPRLMGDVGATNARFAVQEAPGAQPTEEGLKAALRDALSSFKIPRRIVFINQEDVPVTQTGKIKLFEAADLIASHLDAPVPAE